MSRDVAIRHLHLPTTQVREHADAAKRQGTRMHRFVTAVAVLAMVGFAGAAQANVANGSFETNNAGSGPCTGGGSSGDLTQQLAYPGSGGSTQSLNSWGNTSTYSFILDGSSTPSQNNSASFNSGGSCIGVYGPAGGILAPVGNYFLGVDGAYGGATQGNNSNTAGNYAYLTQTVTGLTVGATYAVSFFMSATEQTGYTGNTTDTWDLGFSPVGTPPTANATNATSTGASATLALNQLGCTSTCTWYGSWVQQTVNLVAGATSEVLWFLANDTETLNNNLPPFSLLDGISLTQTVPEPPAYAMLLVGLLALLGARRFLRSRG